MHRVLVIVQNLAELGGEYLEAAEKNGLIAFVRAYIDSYHDGSQVSELEFGEKEKAQMGATIEVSKEIVRVVDKLQNVQPQ